MTEPRTGSHLNDLLGPWIPHQRWYPAKGREARMEVVGGLELPGAGTSAGTSADAGDVRVLVHVVRVVGAATGAATDVVQVPLVHRRAPREDGAAHLVGVLTDADGGSWHVYDGPQDPAFVDALLALLAGGAPAVGLGDDGSRTHAAGTATGRRLQGASTPAPGSPAHVLRGEQSNTSIIVEPAEGEPVIVKVFRTLHPGRNPDVEVQAAMTEAGVDAVPHLAGWLEGAWPASPGDTGDALVSGDLAVASEFLAGAQDAWREATAAVADGTDFSGPARALGAATAQVHAAMAEALPSRPATPQDATDLVEGLRRRTAWALDSAPALAEHADALRAAVDGLDVGDLPDLQRVHGDYHLGQVLSVPGRGWVLLDFEGEPLRPLAERTLPDLALRDVAGMLRSFDYAARQAGGGEAAQAWAAASREAFCAGYAEVAGADPREHGRLLDALELDKALYEVVYETRNRPEWLPVPLAAVERILSAR